MRKLDAQELSETGIADFLVTKTENKFIFIHVLFILFIYDIYLYYLFIIYIIYLFLYLYLIT